HRQDSRGGSGLADSANERTPHELLLPRHEGDARPALGEPQRLLDRFHKAGRRERRPLGRGQLVDVVQHRLPSRKRLRTFTRSLRGSCPCPIGADKTCSGPFARRVQSPLGLPTREEGVEVLSQNEIDDLLPTPNGTDAIGQFPRLRDAGGRKRGLLTSAPPLSACEDLGERVAPVLGRPQLFPSLVSLRLGLRQRRRRRGEILLPLLQVDTRAASLILLLASLPLCALQVLKPLNAF